MTVTREQCAAADRDDPLGALRTKFVLDNDTIYLLGNSLGALPAHAPEAFARVVRDEWGEHRIGGWNRGWYAQPVELGNRLARLIGAREGEVVVADSTSMNLMKVVHAALQIGAANGRASVGYDDAMFPTDAYVTASVARAVGLTPVPLTLTDGALPSYADDLAAVVLSHVDYRTGRLLDMRGITADLHERGILAIWDLSHSVGALPVVLDECDVDYAVGCTYKYLNSGPGAPAFVFVNARLLAETEVLPQGWFAHSAPFAMAPTFDAAADIRRMLVGTPPVIAMAGIAASLDIFDQVDLAQLRAKSIALTGTFMTVVDDSGVDVTIATPREADTRGSQVSLRHTEAYRIVRNLADRGVIGDFREPDIFRFGFAPLYTRFVDSFDAATAVVEVIRDETWRDPRYAVREAVT